MLLSIDINNNVTVYVRLKTKSSLPLHPETAGGRSVPWYVASPSAWCESNT